MSQVLSDKVMRAARPHRCDQCLKPISSGDRYRRQVHTFEEFTVYRAHKDCDDLAGKLFAAGGMRPLIDDGVLLHKGIEPEDRDWIRDEFPDVSRRLGL